MIRVFQVFIPKSVVALIALEFCVISACLIFSLSFIFSDLDLYLLYENGLAAVAIGTLGIMAGLYWQDGYSNLNPRSNLAMIQMVVQALGIEFLLQAFLLYVQTPVHIPRTATFVLAPVLLVVLPFWRRLYSRALYADFALERVLVLGTDSLGQDLAGRIAGKPELGMTIVGYMKEPGTADADLGTPFGLISDVGNVASRVRPDRIVVNLVERRQVLPVQTLMDLRLSGIRIQEAGYVYEQVFGRVATSRLRPSQLIFSTELGPQASSIRLQTIYSFAGALIGLVVAAPIMLLVALGVRLTSVGPVLFRQTRVGLNGRHFTLYKFRSMRVDAEARTGAVWATKNDPRVTSIGGFLRRSRLDELPQLFNVLRGDMVIVGPRPERPEFVNVLSEQIPFYRQRHCVKPGVTGWAQINYKYGETFEDTVIKLEYDLYYIKNVSFTLDLYVVFHTLKVMLASDHGQ